MDLQVELTKVRWDNSRLRKKVKSLNAQNKLLADQLEFYRRRSFGQNQTIENLRRTNESKEYMHEVQDSLNRRKK